MMLIYAYGVPLLFSLLPAFFGDFGATGGWCWIKLEAEGKNRNR